MIAQTEQLIDPGVAPAATPEPLCGGCCRAVESLAGDCRLTIGARMRMVERACGFGTACTQGCATDEAAEVGFSGRDAVRGGRVSPPGTVRACNEHDF